MAGKLVSSKHSTKNSYYQDRRERAGRKVPMPVANSILRSFVVVVTGVGNAVDKLGVQLASLWWHESKRYDRFGRVLEVVRNIPDRARVLGVRVGVVVELNVGRSLRFGVRHLRLSIINRTAAHMQGRDASTK